MGIKHFFTWFRNKYPEAFLEKAPTDIDHLMIDMNGIIHEAAQFIYKYGQYQHVSRLRFTTTPRNLPPVDRLYEEIKKRVNIIIQDANPKKSVFLAIDGVAPQSKQNQQRQRRFRTTIAENKYGDEMFDSNNITAGTIFMKNLSEDLSILDWVKTKKYVEMSTDSSPGEGEHKLIDKIRKTSKINDVFCIVGLDADLIMLCLLLNKPNIYVMREFNYIKKINLPIPAQDFLVLSCFMGNDFLPQIPSLEIREEGFELLLSHYNQPLVKNGKIIVSAISKLLSHVTEFEQNIMINRGNDKTRFVDELWEGNIDKYRQKYHEIKLEHKSAKSIIYSFFKGIQWVVTYYTIGIPSWTWYYPYHYTLHTNFFTKFAPYNVTMFRFQYGQPSTSHEQLLRVMPPKSKNLIPKSLHEKLDELPTTFKIDKAGKRQEWEAIIIVDFI